MASSQFKQPVIEDVAEADYRAYFDSSVLRVWHLRGKDCTFKITGVARLASTFKGEDRKQPLLQLVNRKGNATLPLALNKTNAKTIAALYGNNPFQWVGKTITLFPSTTDVGGETRDCIRIRNQVPGTAKPAGKTNRNGAHVIRQLPEATITEAEFVEREPGDDTDDEPPPGALESDHVIR